MKVSQPFRGPIDPNRMKCTLCETRRARRHCPGVHGEICALCCGEEREVTIDCPLDCQYLRDARQHEKRAALDPEQVPSRDVEITERFLQERQELVAAAGRCLLDAVLETTGAVDADVREALEALVRTLKTRESGLIYETRPNNPYAARIQRRFQANMDEYRKRLRDQLGMATIRDADLLGVLVFLQRVEFTSNNGRKRGRAFVGLLASNFSKPKLVEPGPEIIL